MTLLEEIDELMDQDAYTWAFTTLSAIRKSLTDGGEVTDGRIRAVRNIKDAVTPMQRSHAIGTSLPSDRYRTSRRYEGYEK